MKVRYSLGIQFLFAILLSVTACQKDDDITSSSTNKNANISSTQAEATRLEIPKLKGGNSTFLVHSTSDYGVNYCVEWDCDKKAQRWTAYEWYASNSVSNWNRNNWDDISPWYGDPFQEDTSISASYRTTLADYSGSGYNRGHICASADRLCSRDVNEQTFYLSNMQPQWYKFNSGIWLKMENKVRSWNNYSFRDTLYVVKGGTIDKSSLINSYTGSGLIVPKYFFMAVLCKNKYGYKAMAFWVQHLNVDHSGDDLADYAISIDELEEKTGIDFFCNLPDEIEDDVESKVYTNLWNL